MRTIPSLIVDDEIVLRPAGPAHIEALTTAFQESWPEVVLALPWYEMDQPMEAQLRDYLTDVEGMGRFGTAYHWVIVNRSDESFLGLVAFDRTTRTRLGHWNLGYWVVKGATRRGIATRTCDKALDWISTTQGGPTAVEITVDPNNEAGVATCESLVRRWAGRRAEEGDGSVVVGGNLTEHITFILPRLPLVRSGEPSHGTVWLSLDTDDISHLPRNSGHPSRSKRPEHDDTYRMSEKLASAWKAFLRWRDGAGKGIPVTLFVVAEQLDDPRFADHLRQLLDSDSAVTIASHGNRHRCWSAWPADPFGLQEDLSLSLRRLAEFAGDSFRPWFRAPGGYAAPWMAAPLAAAGVSLDSSVNPSWLTRRKAGPNRDWMLVSRAVRSEGLVERQWLTAYSLPVTGPALRIPLLSVLARHSWKRATKGMSCASEMTLMNPEQRVDSLYWHLLDHARKGASWSPPLHPTLESAVVTNGSDFT
jgi:RimJ/RimL family protein N-acetyltransferase